jgi:hypothetical protein
MSNAILDACFQSCDVTYVENFGGVFVFNLDKCINEGSQCFFNCYNQSSEYNDFIGTEYYKKYNSAAKVEINTLLDIGKAGAGCSIVASCLFILVSVYLRRYRRWIEQIVLSKVVCDLIYAIVLITQFSLKLKREEFTHFIFIVVSLLGLVWIPVLFFEVRNVITFPFSSWGFSKLVNRWLIALFVSVGWSCLCFIKTLQTDENASYVFQYVPIIYISASTGTTTINPYAPYASLAAFVTFIF